MTKSRIILMNGVGSAGKSSIASALQTILPTPYLHVQMDSFLEMMPEAYQNHKDGFSYDTELNGDNPSIAIKTGWFGAKTLDAMQHAIVAMASVGVNLIVDDVMLADTGQKYRYLLAGFDVLTIGVYASLDVLEERERLRGDRMAGLARWQYDRVHEGMVYDLEGNTDASSAMECAL